MQGWNLLGKKRLGYIGHAPVRVYYMLRNSLALAAQYKDPEARAYLRRVRRSLFRMLLQSPERARIWHYARRACRDARCGISGPVADL